MDYLHSKHNLKTFSQENISHLKKYFEISSDNQDDLLWMLAIAILSGHKRSQMPPDLPDYRTLEGLPLDMLFETVKHLDPSDIICKSSKNLDDLVCKNDEFWHRYARHRFPKKISVKRDDQTWKEFVKHLHQRYIKLEFFQIVGRDMHSDVFIEATPFNIRTAKRLQKILEYPNATGSDLRITDHIYTTEDVETLISTWTHGPSEFDSIVLISGPIVVPPGESRRDVEKIVDANPNEYKPSWIRGAWIPRAGDQVQLWFARYYDNPSTPDWTKFGNVLSKA